MIGFNRRFDSNAVRIRKAITDGEIGDLNLLRITSYDPSPPPVDYLKVRRSLINHYRISSTFLDFWWNVL